MAHVQASRAAAAALIVQQGKFLDSIDQLTQRDETPDAEIAKAPVRERRDPKSDKTVQFTLR